jgi:hypothetical protein
MLKTRPITSLRVPPVSFSAPRLRRKTGYNICVRSEMKKNDSLTVGANVAPDGSVDRYPDVFNLLSHVDDLEPEDLFQVKLDTVLSKSLG